MGLKLILSAGSFYTEYRGITFFQNFCIYFPHYTVSPALVHTSSLTSYRLSLVYNAV